MNDQVLELVDHLCQLGHRRIVKLVREERRTPIFSVTEVWFLEKLEAHGIPTGPYHVPDWEETPEGLQRCLRSLFKTTPPTALIVDDVSLFFAVVLQLAEMGLSIPGDVSVACTDYSPDFDWCDPPVTHIKSDRARCIKQVVQWMGSLSKAREDRTKIHASGTLILGGTIGPVRG